jgi:protein TonB
LSAASPSWTASDPDRRDVARWAASFAAVLGLHAIVAVAIVSYRGTPPTQASDLPAVVMMDLAPPAAPSAPPAETMPSEERPEAAAPDPTPEPVVEEPVPETPPEVPEPPPVLAQEPPPPEPVPPPPPVQEIVPPQPVVPKAAVALPPPPPKVTKRAERQEARKPPSQASGAQTTASLPSASSGSSAASRSSWQSQLVSYLQRSLRYPPGSRGGGAASVSFSVNRQGRVLSASLARSAGSSELDQAALALFRGSLPPPPPDVPGNSFTFTIPIRFSTR